MLPSSDYAGQETATLPYSGDFDVKEAFAEIRLPIVEDGFVKELSLDAGYRYSDFDFGSHSTGESSYNLGLFFAPIEDVSFRGGFARAVRAPSIRELFEPQHIAVNGNGDPCAGTFGLPSLTQCQATGVTSGQYGSIADNPAGQYNGLVGGNPNLDPEISDSWTVGTVIRPRFIPGLTLTADWFDISVDKAIAEVGQDAILFGCVDTRDPSLCGLIHRDSTGSLWQTQNGYVRDIPQNFASFKTSGIDFTLSYDMDLGGAGGLNFSVLGTWLDQLETDNGVSDQYDCAGYYGPTCGLPAPEWRHTARVSYSTPGGFGASLQWRYFGSVDVENANPSPALHTTNYAPFNETIAAQNYFDLTLSARFAGAYTLRLGVNNLFDKAPPIIGSNGGNLDINACPGVVCSGNTFPNYYDAMGRYVFAGITLDF